MSAVDTAAHVRDLLDQLGDIPDKVADRFRALGIKGTRRHLTRHAGATNRGEA